MTDSIADVKRLFKTYSTFLGGTKRRQAALTTDTLQWMVHDDDSDTVAFEVSDDSLQALLATEQTFTGPKTFEHDSGVVLKSTTAENNISLIPVDNGEDGDDLYVETAGAVTSRIMLRPGGTTVLEVGRLAGNAYIETQCGLNMSAGSIEMAANTRVRIGHAAGTQFYYYANNTYLQGLGDGESMYIDTKGPITSTIYLRPGGTSLLEATKYTSGVKEVNVRANLNVIDGNVTVDDDMRFALSSKAEFAYTSPLVRLKAHGDGDSLSVETASLVTSSVYLKPCGQSVMEVKYKGGDTNSGLIVMQDKADFEFSTTTGSVFGTSAAQKWAVWGGTPRTQLLKSEFGNWASLANVVAALVSVGLFDQS